MAQVLKKYMNTHRSLQQYNAELEISVVREIQKQAARFKTPIRLADCGCGEGTFCIPFCWHDKSS